MFGAARFLSKLVANNQSTDMVSVCVVVVAGGWGVKMTVNLFSMQLFLRNESECLIKLRFCNSGSCNIQLQMHMHTHWIFCVHL